jgi:Uma2 family endonuclease
MEAGDYLAQGDLRELADRLLESKRVEYVDEGVLLIMNPLAAEHRGIVRLIVRDITLASARGVTSQDWDINSEHPQPSWIKDPGPPDPLSRTTAG